MLVDLAIAAVEVGFEWRIEEAKLGPVGINGAYMMNVETSFVLGAFKRSKDSSDTWLGGCSGQAVCSGIDNVGTGFSAGNHRGDTGAGRVVSMDMNGEIWILLANGTNEECSGSWFQDASHVLDAENMDVELDEFLNKIKVVFQVVLLFRILWWNELATIAS